MRLIDADALIRSTIYNPLHVPYITKSDIEAAPTVDAIPIEFIRERMEGYYKNSYTELGACLETLIEDWRKNNDTAD